MRLTNLDQLLFEDAGATKRELVDYLEAVHRHLRYTSIAARLARYPSNVSGGFKASAFVEPGLGDGLLTRLLWRTAAEVSGISWRS